VASYSDIKQREVPDWVSYGLLFSAFGIRALASVDLGWKILLAGVLGFLPFLLIAYLFYYTDQWGGGDSKLLMGMGAVLGITYPLTDHSFVILWFFLALLFIGALWGIIWMVFEALRNKEVFIEKFRLSILGYKKMHWLLLTMTFIFLGLSFFFNFILYFSFFPLAIFYLCTFVNAVEKSCFYHHITPSKLTEGDWLAQNITLGGKKMMVKRTLGAGDIKELRLLHKKGKLETVLIKEGVPFIPSFLFAYLFILFGEKIMAMILKMVF